MHLDEFRQTFVIRLVMRVQYKDGHKTHYSSRRQISLVMRLERRVTETHNQTNYNSFPKFVQADNASLLS